MMSSTAGLLRPANKVTNNGGWQGGRGWGARGAINLLAQAEVKHSP